MAMQELRRTSANVRRFWNLLYAVGVGTTVTLCFALALLVWGAGTAGIASGITALVGGAGVTFLVKLKNDAVRELEAAKAALRRDCRVAAGQRGGEGRDEEENPVLVDVLDLL